MSVVLHRLSLPILRPYLRRTQRAYVMIIHDSRVLLIKPRIGDNRWWLPGGGVHKGESAQAAAVREAREEVGIVLRADHLQQVSEGIYKQYKLGFQYTVFATILTELPTIRIRKRELKAAEFMDYSVLRDATLFPSELLSPALWRILHTVSIEES